MISFDEWRVALDDPSPEFLENLAQRSSRLTRQYFGRAVSLFTPLYLSNYCDSGCGYCGFNRRRNIRRQRLGKKEMDAEMAAISSWGIENVLLLTGESPRHTPVAYLCQAVDVARRHFTSVSLEVYPLAEEDYRTLVAAGADGFVLYQETYDRGRYGRFHPDGQKADYHFRLQAPERMARAGARTLTLGVLLGLSEIATDVHSLFSHLEKLQSEFPGIEYNISFPRLIPLPGTSLDTVEVRDTVLIKLICLARLLFPRVGITLSTREPERIRDHALELGVTRISVASQTGVGGYRAGSEADPQFEVRDRRTMDDIKRMLVSRGFDPVFTDGRGLARET